LIDCDVSEALAGIARYGFVVYCGQRERVYIDMPHDNSALRMNVLVFRCLTKMIGRNRMLDEMILARQMLGKRLVWYEEEYS